MNKPIILDNSVERGKGNYKTFKYNYFDDMNYIFINHEEVPYIDIDTYLKGLKSSTRVENKDVLTHELYTKTEVDRERDDEEISLLELLTKTAVERERDDEESINFN